MEVVLLSLSSLTPSLLMSVARPSLPSAADEVSAERPVLVAPNQSAFRFVNEFNRFFEGDTAGTDMVDTVSVEEYTSDDTSSAVDCISSGRARPYVLRTGRDASSVLSMAREAAGG